MKIPNWDKRSIFTSNLLNPAFCGEVIRKNIVQYCKDSGKEGLPFSLAFFILPIILHKQTRNLLPKTKRTKLHEWLTNNEELKLIIVPRIKYLTPYTRESLLFLYGHGIIEFNTEGEIVPVITRSKKFHKDYTEEIADIFNYAGKLGTWINTFPSEKITYTFFGIKP
jgi:hypothetical protein